MSGRLVVQITCGAEAPERLNQGLTVAATATASGVDVSVWFAGDATWMAVPGRADTVALEHAAPLRDLLDIIVAAGTLTVCTQCAARRGLEPADLIAGVVIRGAAAFVEEVMAEGARSLVY